VEPCLSSVENCFATGSSCGGEEHKDAK